MNTDQFAQRAAIIFDKSNDVVPLIDEVLSHWSYDLFSRRPGAAYTEDGVFKGTDLDLACFMAALVSRGAIINIPKYTARRAAHAKEGEYITSKDNRHGKCIGLTANKEVFSFSIRINDANVMTSENVGAFRNFMLVDVDGQWYDGWQKVEFLPNRKENNFLDDKKLWDGHTVTFQHFVHPNRWISFYGRHYLLTKMLIQRLEDQAKWLGVEVKRLLDEGVRFPVSGKAGTEAPEKVYSKKVGSEKVIQIDAFEAEVGGLSLSGDYKPVAQTSDALKEAADLRSKLIYTKLPALRFATRATELAFHKHGTSDVTKQAKKPAWAQNANWQTNVVLPKTRKKWNQIDLFGFQLRYRVWIKSERVAATET